MRVLNRKLISEIGNWVLINPPVVQEYDGINPLKKTWGSGINLGLLQVAKTIRHYGGNVRIIDLGKYQLERDLIYAVKQLPIVGAYGISNNFYTTYISSKTIAKVIRARSDALIVLGGSHIGNLPRLKNTDEKIIIFRGSIENRQDFSETFYGPNPNFLWPSESSQYFVLEVTRGCPYHCRFCAHPSFQERKLEDIVGDIDWFSNNWPVRRLAYATYNFGESIQLENKILNYLKDLSVKFTTQGRADTLIKNGPEFVKLAYDSGLRNLSIGLESIRRSELLNMNKTSDPSFWVKCVEELFRWCYEYGILVKLNIILFDGENSSTIGRLKEFIDKNKKYISGISCSPLMAYPGTKLYSSAKMIKKISPFFEKYYNEREIFPVAISKYSFQKILSICNDIEKEFDWKSKLWCD